MLVDEVRRGDRSAADDVPGCRSDDSANGYSERLRTLHEIDRAILSALSPQAIAEAAILRLRQLVNCPRISIVLFDQETDQAVILAVYDEHNSSLTAGTIAPLRANFGQAPLNGEVRLIADARAIPEPSDIDRRLLEGGVLSYIGVPLMSRDQVIGCLNLGASRPFAFNAWHVDIAREVSNSLAVAIQNARLHEQVRKHASELEQLVSQRTAELAEALAARQDEFDAINRIARLTVRTADLPGTLSKALEIGVQALGMDIGTLSLLDTEGQQLELMAVHCDEADRPKIVQQSKVCLKKGLSRLAIARQRTVGLDELGRSSDVQSAGIQKMYARLKIQSAISVPIISDSTVVGVMVVMGKTKIDIGPSAATFLEALATHIAVLIQNWRLRSQVRTLSIMEERRRLASELHDSVTQSLFSLCLAAEGLRGALSSPTPGVRRALDLLVKQASTVRQEMRTLINELRPVELRDGDLDAALRAHVDSLRGVTNIDVDLKIHGEPRRLPLPIQNNLNRIAQEALSNIARHSRARHAELDLEIQPDVVCLTVKDDGAGFDPQGVARHESESLGLLSMRERAEMLGGVLIVRSAPDQSTTITAKIPLDTELEWVNDAS